MARLASLNDPDALARLYDMYGPRAYGISVNVLRDQMQAEEVVQEAFFKVWRTCRRYDSEQGSVHGWILAIVHNQAVDALRKRRIRGSLDLPLNCAPEHLLRRPDVWGEVFRSLEGQRVQLGLASLPEPQRATIVLAYYGGCTHSQIARILDIPLGTVKGRLRLAMDKLRISLLEPEGGGASSLEHLTAEP